MTQIVWRDLVDVIVEPVSEQQISVAAPGRPGRVLRIVFWEVVVRDIRVKARLEISEKFGLEGIVKEFGMARDKGDKFVTGEQVRIPVFRFSEDLKIGIIADQLRREVCITGVRREERIVKTARQQRMRVQDMVFVYAREFFGAGLFRNTVEDIQCSLNRPTDEKRGGDVIFCPLQHLFDLRPVGNVIELHQT